MLPDQEHGRRWSVRQVQASDRDATIALMQRAFGKPHENAVARWECMFLQNPASRRLHYLVADAGERLAGQYAMVPLRLQHVGRPVLGLLSLDTATDPEFERQGILTTLARRVYAEAREEAPIVFGCPNPKSAPVLYNRLDYVALRPFPVLYCPLGGLGNATQRLRPALAPLARAAGSIVEPTVKLWNRALVRLEHVRGAEVQPLDDFGPWVDELWSELAPDLGTAVIRDATYLRWRFAPARGAYRRHALVRNGKPVGLAVTGRAGQSWCLEELMVPKHDAAGARLLLGWAVLEAAREGAAGIFTFATRRHPHYRVHFASGFIPVPTSLTPTLSFGVHHNGPGVIPDKLFHIDDWYVSGSDLDVP